MTKKKKILIIVLSIVGAIAIAVGITLAVLLTRDPETPPPPGDGTIYQTKSESFWVGTGSAYISFDYVAEPEQKEEGKLYGYVFKVNVNYEGTWQAWLSGHWEMNAEATELKLTATWKSGDTALHGATSGEPKTYTLANGVFKISIDLPSASDTVFTLDPVADKVGSEKPATHECKHVCETCGKCTDANCEDPVCADKCEGHTPSVTVAQELVATATSGQVTAYGKIECMTDKTWKLSIDYMGQGNYTETASGTWAMNGYTELKLTVTTDSANALANDEYTIAVDASDTSNIKYTVTIVCNIPQVGELTFNFSNVTVRLEMTATATSGQVTAYGKIECMTDNTWKLSIDYTGQGNYTETASGTWTMNGYTGMTLTVVTDTANAIASDTVTVAFDTTATPGSIVYTAPVTCSIPQVGNLTFNFTATLPISA